MGHVEESLVEDERRVYSIICFHFLAESNFFVKVSEQRQRKRQQNQLVSVDSPEENVEICSVPNSVESMLFSYEIPTFEQVLVH